MIEQYYVLDIAMAVTPGSLAVFYIPFYSVGYNIVLNVLGKNKNRK